MRSGPNSALGGTHKGHINFRISCIHSWIRWIRWFSKAVFLFEWTLWWRFIISLYPLALLSLAFVIDCKKWPQIPSLSLCMPFAIWLYRFSHQEVKPFSPPLSSELGFITCSGQWTVTDTWIVFAFGCCLFCC